MNEGRYIDTDPVLGRKRIKISDVEVSNQPVGLGAEIKNRITGKVIKGKRSKSVSMIERQMPGRLSNLEADSKHYIETWASFKKAGLPVVPTVRRTDKGTILVTDVKADGSECFGKSYMRTKAKFLGEESSLSLTPEETNFMNLTNATGFKAIMIEAQSIADRATENDLQLAEDEPFELLIKPDGSWKLVILDLTYTENSGGSKYQNDKLVKEFEWRLNKLRSLLMKKFTPKL